MTDDTKTEITERTTIIDGKTGEVEKRVRGTMKGFGKGLADHIKKGVAVKIEADVRVGQLPPGHPDEGKWAVQINLLPFDSQLLANTMADRATPIIEGLLGARAIVTQ